MNAPVLSRLDPRRFYEAKTDELLAKYGPGPRVHYHTGIPGEIPRDASAEDVRRALIEAQERMLRRAAASWGAVGGELLDVGCGLGGGALFWAAEHGARVTAVTNVPVHAAHTERFARLDGVADRVRTFVADACNVPMDRTYDTVVAIESSCYFPRARWFRAMAGRLRAGGRILIADVVVVDRTYKPHFDRTWCTDVAVADEYDRAAASAGCVVGERLDLSGETLGYWDLDLAYVQRSGRAGTSGASAAGARKRFLRAGWAAGALRYLLMSFVRP